MNLSERIVDYLRKHVGEVICDDCLRTELNTRHSLTSMLAGFNPNYVVRKVDTCGTCGQVKETMCQFAEPTREELAAKRRELKDAWERLRRQ